MAWRLKTARLTDASLLSNVDDALGELEGQIAGILGAPLNTDITASPFGINNAGQVTNALLASRFASDLNNPSGITYLGLRTTNSSNGLSGGVALSRLYKTSDGTTSPWFFFGDPGNFFVDSSPLVFGIKMGTGELFGKACSTSGQGLVPKSSGSGSEYLNGLCQWASIGSFAQQARVDALTPTTITSGVTTTPNWVNETLDTSTMVDIAGAPTVVTCRANGNYHVSANVFISFTAPTASDYILQIVKNGATVIAQRDILVDAGSTFSPCDELETIVALVATDTVSIKILQSTGSDASVALGGNLCVNQVA